MSLPRNSAHLAHDAIVYVGAFLTLWGANTPAGAGWDSLLAAVPPALSQAWRKICWRNG